MWLAGEIRRLAQGLTRLWRPPVQDTREQKTAPENHWRPPEPETVKTESGSRAVEIEASAPVSKERPPESDETSADDLTAIRGIGPATEKRLNDVGIRSYAQMAHATPQELRKALGTSRRGAKVDKWIKKAQERAT